MKNDEGAADKAAGGTADRGGAADRAADDATLTARLARLYTGAVHDVLRAMGHDNCVLPSALRPLDPAL